MNAEETFSLELLINARKMRTHCSKWTVDQILDELVNLYNKYDLPRIESLQSQLKEVKEELAKTETALSDEITTSAILEVDKEVLQKELEQAREEVEKQKEYKMKFYEDARRHLEWRDAELEKVRYLEGILKAHRIPYQNYEEFESENAALKGQKAGGCN